MENKDDTVVISRFVWESYNASHERTTKRLLIALAITIALLFASNMAWLWFFNQFDFESQTVMFDTDKGGDNSYIGNDGDITNGSDGSNKDNNDTQEETP